MNIENYSGIIEAILFYEKDVVSIEKLEKFTKLSPDDIRLIIEYLNDEYSKSNHGINIVELANGYTFQIKKEFFNSIKDLYNIKSKQKLSKSCMTVLSIIAYKQPITKNEIDDIRGVSSDNQIKILMEKNIIEIKGRKDTVGKPLLYGTTDEFLKLFNLKSLNDLPKLNELKSDEFSLNE